MINLLQQIKHRRLALKLKQNDMLMSMLDKVLIYRWFYIT